MFVVVVVCPPPAVRDETSLSELRAAHARLHRELEAIVARDPVVEEALGGEDGGLIVAVRSALIQDLVREAARVYLDQVVLDLGDLDAHASGDLRHRTLLGRVTLGHWRLDTRVVRLEVRLRALPPRLRVVAPDELNLKLPVEAMEATGRVRLRFVWRSASLAKLVCRGFDLTRELDGRTLRQEHTVGGTFRVAARAGAITVDPLLADDSMRLKMDLTPRSWEVVEEALRTQDSLGRCGLLLNPGAAMRHLRQLAAEGIEVRLPRAMFKTLRFPASFQHTALIDERPVTVAVRTRSFEITPRLTWSRAAVGIAVARAASTNAPRATPE